MASFRQIVLATITLFISLSILFAEEKNNLNNNSKCLLKGKVVDEEYQMLTNTNVTIGHHFFLKCNKYNNILFYEII